MSYKKYYTDKSGKQWPVVDSFKLSESERIKKELDDLYKLVAKINDKFLFN